MKLKNLFAMTTIALSLIACSSNEPSDPAMEAPKPWQTTMKEPSRCM